MFSTETLVLCTVVNVSDVGLSFSYPNAVFNCGERGKLVKALLAKTLRLKRIELIFFGVFLCLPEVQTRLSLCRHSPLHPCIRN